MSAAIAVEGLEKRFGEHLAVGGVSFAAAAGESLGIVGESGSGKTTIARMLAGLERPTAGRIVLDGDDRTVPARRARERRRRGRGLQLVFQDPYVSLDPSQTVGDCLGEVVGLHFGRSRAERTREVASLLEQVGLDPRHGRARPRALSGGQRQRVAIARALAAQPRVLVLDEAVSALDVSVQAQILNLLAELRERIGTTYLFISHDLAVVRQLTDRCIVLRRGVVVEEGPTASILDDPQHEYTQLLRASVPQPGWKPPVL